MSIRSLVELNHDYAPLGPEQASGARWLVEMCRFYASGDADRLPRGVTLKGQRHHSNPEPTADGQLAAELADIIAPLLVGKQHVSQDGKPLIGGRTRKRAAVIAAAVVSALRNTP